MREGGGAPAVERGGYFLIYHQECSYTELSVLVKPEVKTVKGCCTTALFKIRVRTYFCNVIFFVRFDQKM